MSETAIEFYFDFNSPYGYIAAHKIDALAAKYRRAVDWKPILLGAVFEITGVKPLTMVPLKGDYSKHDFARAARYHGVEYRPPIKFPFSPISASRALYWAQDRDPQQGHELGLALYQAALRDQKDISGPEAVADIAASVGLDKDSVKAALQDPEVKARLKREVDAAVAKNVFGSPFIIVDGEGFWGMDRFDMVEKWLDTGGW